MGRLKSPKDHEGRGRDMATISGPENFDGCESRSGFSFASRRFWPRCIVGRLPGRLGN